MRKGYFSLIALSLFTVMAMNAAFAQSTAGPLQITSFADSTNMVAGDNFPQAILRGQTYNIQGAYGNIGNAQSARVTYDVYKSDWSGLDYSHTWPVANDTIGSIDGTINLDFTIPTDAALKTDFPEGFAIIQARVVYDPVDDTFWNIFVTVEDDTSATAILNPTAIEGISMYPNPATNGVITIETPKNLRKQVLITDLSGRVVMAGELEANGTVDVSRLTTGLYTVAVKEGRNVSTLKLNKE